jgi:DNA invertase Pin-like site-specific DNA recombinase
MEPERSASNRSQRISSCDPGRRGFGVEPKGGGAECAHTLLVWDGSRIARNLEDFGWVLNLVEEHGRDGYDVMQGQPLASLASQIGGVISAEERRKIKANTHRRLLGRVERKMAPPPCRSATGPSGSGKGRARGSW